MRKFFCDWCNAEMPAVVLNMKYQRRIGAVKNQPRNLNLMIELEFLDEINNHQDICKKCVCALLRQASDDLENDKSDD